MGKKAAAPDPKAAAPQPDQRPPRPSPGHKWDEEKKQWVGKGSLDERKAAKLKEAAPKEAADGTVLKSYQSMPSQLLLEWAQREKRPKPYYSQARAWDRTKFRQKVVLPDPKVAANSLEFAPYDDSDSWVVAKEHAAVVALLKVQSNMPLERKLPEPYASIWKASLAESQAAAAEAKAKPKAKAKEQPQATPWAPSQSTATVADAHATSQDATGSDGAAAFTPAVRAASNFASRAEREAAERKRTEERNRRDAAREMRRQADRPAPILLARNMRLQLHEALGLQDEYQSIGAADVEAEIGSAEAKAVSKCVDWGFAASEALRALMALREESEQAFEEGAASAQQLAEEMRQWLCLHLPEEDLPEEFAAGRGQFTVHKRTEAPAKQGSSEPAPSNQSEFQLACEELSTWLRRQLQSALGESDAEALHASVDALILGVEDPKSMDDEELEEVAENASMVLSTEDGLEQTCEELKTKWKAICEARHAMSEANATQEGEEEVADGVAEETDAPAAAAPVSATGFFENGASRGDVSKPSKPRQSGPWFGWRAGESSLQAKESEWSSTAAGQRMQKQRDTLPAAKSKETLVQLCTKHAVVLVQGETGCGKTTQVGQFLLESDPTARVIVTQPRRVAATSVAHRVAEERGERLGEGSVGYSVRGESKLQRDRCRLLFCTNGVLLRRVLGNSNCMLEDDTCTHLVVDEVHERSVEIDLLLTILRHLLPQRPKLRVVLMSATMDLEQLAAMFKTSKPPVVKIPGRTFPVSQLFVEDVEDQFSSWKWCGSLNKSGGAGPTRTLQALLQLDFGAVADLALFALRGQLEDAPQEGAVLIFVAGVGEIDRVSRELLQRLNKGEANVLPLHGGLAPDQQRRCFEVPGKGAPRKIVISTNVAETSVTVPDVTIVIDTARERRLQLQTGAVAALLAEGLCAKSSLQQRRGRAGRVRAGLCITLLTKSEHEQLPAMPAPEIEATSLESLCLQVQVAGFTPKVFLAQMPTPPAVERVVAAEKMLVRIGASRASVSKKDSELAPTALGRHLAALPCDVHVGKLLIIGAFLGVASMAADAAAMLSVRSPLKSTAKDAQAEAWRESLRRSLKVGGTKSDHCLYAKILQMWNKGSNSDRRELCKNGAIVWERMAEAASVRSQLSNALRGLGFAASDGDDRCNGEWRALRAAVTGAFYPQVARVQRPPKEFTQGLSGAVEKQAEARQVRYWVTPEEAREGSGAENDEAKDSTPEAGKGHGKGRRDVRAFLHPSCVLFKETTYSCPFVVFSAKQLQQTQGEYSTRLSLSEASEASLYALLLFGGQLQVDHYNKEVVIDDWIRFGGGSTTVVALVERLRKEIDRLLWQKVETPWLRLADESVCQAVSTLLSTDGLG